VTPAGGAVVTAVAPVGLRDRAAGTVGFTTSQGFGRKLERIRRNPRVALAYHAREHGFSALPHYVLVQGIATPREPDRATLEALRPQIERHLGAAKRGRLFWDRWLAAYYADRLVVDVAVERIVVWRSLDCAGEPTVFGTSLHPAEPAPPQPPPAKGTAPRVPAPAAAKKLAALPHRLAATVAADGFPLVLPFDVTGASADGVALRIAGPGFDPGGRRAGLLAHEYRAQLIGLKARQHTGWVEVDPDRTHAGYAPHTGSGFTAPPNKRLLLLANGFMARRGLRAAQRAQPPGA
jgi:hypothetical protein